MRKLLIAGAVIALAAACAKNEEAPAANDAAIKSLAKSHLLDRARNKRVLIFR